MLSPPEPRRSSVGSLTVPWKRPARWQFLTRPLVIFQESLRFFPLLPNNPWREALVVLLGVGQGGGSGVEEEKFTNGIHHFSCTEVTSLRQPISLR